RPHSNYRPLVEAGAQPVFGDLKDRASLDEAVRGVDTVITTANSAQRGGDDNVQTVDLQGNANLIEAAKAAGVQHFVFVSVLGASPESPSPFIQAKAASEQRLRESGMKYTILAPNMLMEVWVPMIVGGPALGKQPVTLVGEGQRRHSFASMGDVAQYAVRSVNNSAAENRMIVIGGPQAVSWRDVAAAYEKALGRPVEVQTVPMGQPIPWLPDVINGLLMGTETYDSEVDMSETSAAFGVRPTSLDEFVQRHVSGAQGEGAVRG
ncbi:MAG TPA: NmrA family NAD(P)-binding protein, partial [Chloroflexia bacterium]|nr:NmrA family NAD(P)-binding protein [Chloroflexia bacterium]